MTKALISLKTARSILLAIAGLGALAVITILIFDGPAALGSIALPFCGATVIALIAYGAARDRSTTNKKS